jgi:uracil-DNA glycosylase
MVDGRGERLAGAHALASIADEIRGCTLCPLAARRTLTVPGEGNVVSDVMLVGEGPGAREDVTGRPFVGPAGQLLGQLLGSIGWRRDDVFITNVVKCRPPGNRDPEPDEIATCTNAYLVRQERALDPAVIVTLGRHSLARYLPGVRISAAHGSLRRTGSGQHIFPMYHPAAALHQVALRQTLFDDVRRLPAALGAAREVLREERAAADRPAVAPTEMPPATSNDDADQLTLF